jgi:penicillin-insensitive murein endopeptidase
MGRTVSGGAAMGLVILIAGAILSPAAARDKVRFSNKVPAKIYFGRAKRAAAMTPRVYGFYTRGCLAGGVVMPKDGPTWQAMRLSRNRNWGHPVLIAVLKHLANDAKRYDGWLGLLVGDLAQPRGGPMLTGHRSHQVGLDADVWLTAMPSRRYTRKERERKSAISMLKTKVTVNPKVWTAKHARLLRRAASYREVERVIVHPAIKKAMCAAYPKHPSWLRKLRPWWGHHYHFHVRIGCPAGSPTCKSQKATPKNHGCGKALDYWIKLLSRPKKKRKPKPKVPKAKRKPRPILSLKRLPKECKQVLLAPDNITAAGWRARVK